MHAEELDLLSGQDVLRRKFDERNVDVAAEERAQKQQQRGPRAHAQPHIGIAQDAHLDQGHQQQE